MDNNLTGISDKKYMTKDNKIVTIKIKDKISENHFDDFQNNCEIKNCEIDNCETNNLSDNNNCGNNDSENNNCENNNCDNNNCVNNTEKYKLTRE